MSNANANKISRIISSNTDLKDGRMSDRMVQNVRLIWLDDKIDESNKDCQNTITQLRRVVNMINTFIDSDMCIQFLRQTADEKVCMIISGVFGQNIIPHVHNLSQVDSIFIFCNNQKYHEIWIKNWSKIKGVFTEIQPICEALKQAARQCEQNAISMSIMGGSQDAKSAEKRGDRLEPSFMYTQIMKEILLTINFEQQHFNEFIEHCRDVLTNNNDEIQNVNKFAQEYRKHTPIWWYTFECFLYPMLNRALRVMDADVMVKMGFFIADLHRQIDQLHREQFGGNGSEQRFIVYRGQGMERDAFQKMKVNKGGLISFNSFLSTSKNRSTALDFAQPTLTNDELVGVLFVMNIVPRRASTPFASVGCVGYYGERESEVLFSMHSVFRIGEITPIGSNARLVEVQLNLVNDKDNDLRQLIDYMRKETFPDSNGWYRLGQVLWKMGEHAKAQRVYEILLKQEIEESRKAPIYHQLGVMKYQQGEYAKAIEYFENSIKIEEKQILRNDTSLANSYMNIGNVYYSMGDYPKALLSHEKALPIRQRSLSPTHPDMAMSYMNIGNVYFSMGDYPKALSSHEKALAIKQQSLPPTHPGLAMSHMNIGLVYYNMSDYPKALSSYEKALAIRQQSLPTTHPDLAMSYMNIGSVYFSMGDYPKALSSHEKALVIKQQSLPSTHPGLAMAHMNIGLVYYNMGDYPKALSSYEKALTIQQQSLPTTHPDLAVTYNNLGLLYEDMGNYSKAHSHFERTVNIAQHSLPSDHPRLQKWKNNVARIKEKL